MNDIISCKYLLPCGDCELDRNACKLFKNGVISIINSTDTYHVCDLYKIQDQSCSLGNTLVSCNGDASKCYYTQVEKK